MDPILVCVDDAAKILSRGRTKMYDLFGQGVIPTVHIGSIVRVPTDAIIDFVKVQRGEAAGMLHAVRS